MRIVPPCCSEVTVARPLRCKWGSSLEISHPADKASCSRLSHQCTLQRNGSFRVFAVLQRYSSIPEYSFIPLKSPKYLQTTWCGFAGRSRPDWECGNDVKAGVYNNEFEFEIDVQRLLSSTHDAHIQFSAGLTSFFRFGAPVSHRICRVGWHSLTQGFRPSYDPQNSIVVISTDRCLDDILEAYSDENVGWGLQLLSPLTDKVHSII